MTDEISPEPGTSLTVHSGFSGRESYTYFLIYSPPGLHVEGVSAGHPVVELVLG